MAATLSRTISNNLLELESLLRDIGPFLEQHQLDAHCQAVELTVEELVTNTIKYGYDDKAQHQIATEIKIDGSSVEIVITDDGHEFNPWANTDPDITKPVEEREIGGLGVFLVRKLASSMNYRRLDGKNIVSVKIGV
jgi:anti-sigma regulatory factor (Ser/Thr protein kinase)